VAVDALDNIRDRFVLERAAKEQDIPLVHGALAGFEGQLMTIYPEDPGMELLYGHEGGGGDLSKSPEAVLGVPALMPSLVATFQAMEVVKILLGRGRTFKNRLVHFDLETGEIKEFSLGSPADPA
jgi:molybdopterin/thiamine biosynthesis adenylyltransferase